MGITIIEGKDMQNEGDVLVNEEVVRLMKWTDGAVGKRLNDLIKLAPLLVYSVMCAIRLFSISSFP